MANQVLYGFLNLENMFARRVNEVGVQVVSAAIDQTIAEHNRQLDALLNLFVQRTTNFKTVFKVPSLARLQPLDNSGRARPIRAAGKYDIGLPIQQAGLAWGADYVTRAKMTVEDANNVTDTLITADLIWVRDHILAALFNNEDWVFDDPDHGELTVKPLANDDDQGYFVKAGQDAQATDTHFLSQVAAISDAANPYPTIRQELAEHPENNGAQFVALVPLNQITATKNLAGFMEADDPNITVGSGSARLTGRLNVATPGEVVGYVDGMWIVQWDNMPAGYIIGVAVGAPKALAMREDEEAELRGYKKVAERADHPFWEAQYLRRMGLGAWNRVAAVIYRIGGAFAIPTGYETPMA